MQNHAVDMTVLQSLKLRHAGILGLCAFINAYPYDIPEFVPDVFLLLGDHLNDPQPIPVSIIHLKLSEYHPDVFIDNSRN